MTRAFAWVAVLVALVAAAPARRSRVPATVTPSPTPQWHLVTDQLHANMRTGAFSAPDPLTMTRTDGSVIQADRATGNYKQHDATLYGHVSVHDASGTFGLKSAKGTQAQSRGPATLTADELHVNDKTRLYDAKGNVHLVQGDTTVRAQTAHLNDATHVLHLVGKVHVVQGDRTLRSDRATYNTQTGFGVANNNVLITFPGIKPSIATPKPIKIKGPKIP